MSAVLASVVAFGRALTPRAWLAIAVAAAVVAVLALTWFGGRSAGVDATRADSQRAQAGAQRQADRAEDRAAQERTTDSRAVEDQREDLTHAVAPFPDIRPSDRRRALNCARLQRDGWDVAALPACSGLVDQP